MPSILNDDDKDTVKRFVPKQSNKIQAVAVARLYVAYPNPAKWTYTELQGAIVLANDLVGNTFWLKMVDISPAGRGVIWDQEIFDTWNYNQDRTFFHSFDLDDCLAGLSFVDEKEARTFKKKMDEREKNASRATKSTPFGGGPQPVQKHSLLSGFFHRHSSAPSPPQSTQSSHSLPLPSMGTNGSHAPSEFALLDAFDPMWREHFGKDLTDKGLTDDFIRDNQEFIIDFLRDEQTKVDNETALPSSTMAALPAPPPLHGVNGHEMKAMRSPPPPPPPAGPSNTSPSSVRRGVPPPPPAPRRSGKADASSVDSSSQREASPSRPKFNAPPRLPEAGKFAHQDQLKPMANPGPPPPPRPAKTPIESEFHSSGSKFNLPPSFDGPRVTQGRGSVPPPPPPRANDSHPSQPGPMIAPPPLPPKVPSANPPPPLPPPSSRPVPPAPSSDNGPPAPPPLPPTSAPPQRAPSPQGPPLPPPLPPSGAPAPPGPPPPPPMPTTSGSGAPPPPPLPPNRDSGYVSGVPATTAPAVDKGRSAMLGDIQKAGGIAALKKVDRTQIRDRSAAAVGGNSDAGQAGSAHPSSSAPQGGGMADALAAALQKRKEKVSKSDDEDEDDEW
ncbi:hypothetical protein CDD81_5034 [Ophiocordyceps australis]|uniref:WH1 domain-containing protein n=1 Tax=Ophiocordyceps australis TaxID=1399860 RepID=A0A2C5YAY2_9HYPO|nr:hypothetical protein CDD81_5034 [Ophiocordyceps australis]